MAAETRKYPTSCTAYYCGEVACPQDCPWLPKLQAFKAWCKRTQAKQLAPIWSPSFYTATVEDK